MTLDRRRFSAALAALGAFGAGAATHAIGQATAPAAPAEGVNYVRLAQPLPVPVPGKIEVVEFFWYECPHCNAFEPALEAWARRLPDDVLLQRVPVWFREEPFTAQQKLYYTVEALDLVPTLHRRVFHAIHNERVRLRTPEDIAAFVLKQGVDPVKFMATYNSFAVQAKSQAGEADRRGVQDRCRTGHGRAGPLLHQRQPGQRQRRGQLARRLERPNARRGRRPRGKGTQRRLSRACSV